MGHLFFNHNRVALLVTSRTGSTSHRWVFGFRRSLGGRLILPDSIILSISSSCKIGYPFQSVCVLHNILELLLVVAEGINKPIQWIIEYGIDEHRHCTTLLNKQFAEIFLRKLIPILANVLNNLTELTASLVVSRSNQLIGERYQTKLAVGLGRIQNSGDCYLFRMAGKSNIVTVAAIEILLETRLKYSATDQINYPIVTNAVADMA